MVTKLDSTASTKKNTKDDSNDENETENENGGSLKKKTRSLGTFPCPDCDKVFTRSDHLSRHHLNHAPKEVFECDYVLEEVDGSKRKCGRTFVRKDLKERHYKRHSEVISGVVKRRRTRDKSDSVSSQSSPSFHQNTQSAQLLPQQQQQPQQLQQPQEPLQAQPQLPPPQPQQQPLAQNSIGQPQIMHQLQQQQLSQQALMNSQGGVQNVPRIPMDQLAYMANSFTPDYTMFNPNLPPSQNDILSWLFTDSPPNAVQNQQQQQRMRAGSIAQSVQSQPHPQQGFIPQSVPSSTVPTPSNMSQTILDATAQNILPANQLIATPQNSNVPIQSHNQTPALQQNQNQVPMVGMSDISQLPNEDPSLTPFYNNNPTQYNNVNIFSNSDNPLDELFLKSLPENGGPFNSNPFFGSNLVTPNSNFNFMTSTASSSSPTATSDSNPTPRALNGLGTTATEYENTILDVINEHSTKVNIPKNKHVYVDTLIVDSCLIAIKESRADLESIFNEDLKEGSQMYPPSIEDRFSYYLSLYWNVYHSQFSILHKPSFDTKSCPPLLLLSMVIVGCNYTEFQTLEKKRSSEFKFSLFVATPLRFMIFQHEDFRTPVKLWILQSLNILEWCEKNFLTRDMHERAHIHHGTTAQLLRRSPLLGGNPTSKTKKRNPGSATTSAGEDESDTPSQDVIPKINDTDYDLFMQWVESESMKRITFMTFYADIMDYIKFRHNPQIMFYQLQLLHLPCDDENLWESTEISGSFKKVVKRQKKLQQQQQQLQQQSQQSGHKYGGIKFGESFLSALKKLIRPHNRDLHMVPKNGLSLFTKKVLFAGLLSIMYQMQQTDIQNTSSLLSVKGAGHTYSSSTLAWKESLTKAFDTWNIEINECCSMDKRKHQHQVLANAIAQQQPSFSHSVLSMSTICHFPMYHLTQIIGMSDLNQYDIAIFGGSPANMSVDATMKDHVIVQAKLNNMWSKYSQSPSKRKSITEIINLKSVVHSYLLLWEFMLKPPQSPPGPQNGETAIRKSDYYLNWNANPDYFDAMYAIGVATLTLWSFAFTTCGLESNRFEDSLVSNENYQELVTHSAESGHDYLFRIREEFTKYLSSEVGGFDQSYSIQPFRVNKTATGKSAHDILCKYAELLPRITDKQNISGLCFLIGTKLMGSQWEILRENARLILNCGLRSIGKKTILCQDLFSIEWE